MTDQSKDEPLTPEELEAAKAVEGEGKKDEGEKEPTLEELKERNEELERRLNRQRTAKAREARAAKRAGDAPAPKSKKNADDDDDDAAAEALAAKDKRIAELEAENNRATALGVAAELGFSKPATAVKLIEWDEIVDPSDRDEVRDALREVAKENPELKRARGPKGDGGEGGPGTTPKTSFNDIIRRAAGRG